MPVTITVRHVPEGVRDVLAARAASSGRSLQAYLLAQLLQAASTQSLEEVVGHARQRASLTGTVLDVAAILADRDADRR